MEPVSPPTDSVKLESLPFDTQKKIALNLPYEVISSFCIVSKKLNRVCNDIYFWKDYLKTNIPEHVNIPLEADINWYKQRIREYPDVKKITDLIKNTRALVKYVGNFNNNWDIFEQIENLEQLYCQSNQLTSLPPLPNLQRLYCENNQLTSLPSLPSLQLLNCENNQLTSLPYLPSLQELYCANNQLTSIPSMPNLQLLFCENNQLTSLPYLPNLQELECENNPLPGFTLRYWKKIWKKL